MREVARTVKLDDGGGMGSNNSVAAVPRQVDWDASAKCDWLAGRTPTNGRLDLLTRSSGPSGGMDEWQVGKSGPHRVNFCPI
ncbi:unnamed protein product [Protopolystoma xenopodis]|uniref:Uncharacterized protein n=1 Tax=Protopolystoma xenopodis TaxID=117903 RepID=A0A448WZ43_9PLAT|nr:unnamed protein product [Protopolystoma xenopodis]